jgi:plastocyanin domain-containing protein
VSAIDWGIAASALGLIAFVNWFFLGKKDRPVAVGPASPGDIVDVLIRVEGGYTPSTIEVPAGARVRMTLDRREDNPCSEEIVIPDFHIRTPVAAHAKTVVEFTATPGRHEFSCGMGMLHGAIIGKEPL